MSEQTMTTGLADPAARAALVAGFDPNPGAAKPDSILVVDNIVRQFGGMTAVDDEDRVDLGHAGSVGPLGEPGGLRAADAAGGRLLDVLGSRLGGVQFT